MIKKLFTCIFIVHWAFKGFIATRSTQYFGSLLCIFLLQK